MITISLFWFGSFMIAAALVGMAVTLLVMFGSNSDS